MKILLVDDSRTIRNIQKGTLKTLGYEDVVEASDSVEALKVLAESKPDLLVLDWNTPNVDGLAMVRKIREHDRVIPIILCTTQTEKSRVLEGVKAGVSSYVVKPFTAQTLAEKISQTMARKQSAPTTAH